MTALDLVSQEEFLLDVEEKLHHRLLDAPAGWLALSRTEQRINLQVEAERLLLARGITRPVVVRLGLETASAALHGQLGVPDRQVSSHATWKLSVRWDEYGLGERSELVASLRALAHELESGASRTDTQRALKELSQVEPRLP